MLPTPQTDSVFRSLQAASPLFDDDVFGTDVELNPDITEESFDDKIVGGRPAAITDHPHQMSFRWHRRHLCGASVISPTRGLTSARCVALGAPAAEYTVLAGTSVHSGNPNEQIRTLNRLLRHPQYDVNSRRNDVALLFWQQPLTLGANVRAIALPQQGAPVQYGQNCNVTGWGISREGGPNSPRLLVATIPTMTAAACNQAFGGSFIQPTQLCAGTPAGGVGACQGDSGGALTINGVQIGIASWSRGCGRPRLPGVYTRVASFATWIRQNM